MKPDVHRRMNLDIIPRQLQSRCKLFLGVGEQESQVQPQRGNTTGSQCVIYPRAADKKNKTRKNV